MDNTTNNDSGFKLDVTADASALGSVLSNTSDLPSSIISPIPDIQTPQNVEYSKSFQPDIKLPESVLFEPTKINVQPQAQPYKSILGDVNFSVKIQPEEVLKKATEIGTNLDLLKKDVQSISDQLRNPDARLTSRDTYEEKVTIPAQNDIFTDRKNKMSKYPDWR